MFPMKTIWIIFIKFVLYTFCLNVNEVERIAVVKTGPYYLSVDSFNNTANGIFKFCKDRNSMCDNSNCTRCVCRNFDTFISDEIGCKNKSSADRNFNADECFYSEGYENTYPTIIENVTKTIVELIYTAPKNPQRFYNSMASGYNNNKCHAKNISHIDSMGNKNLLWLNTNQEKILILSESGGGKYRMKWKLTKAEIKCISGMIVHVQIDCNYQTSIHHGCFVFKVAGKLNAGKFLEGCLPPITTLPPPSSIYPRTTKSSLVSITSNKGVSSYEPTTESSAVTNSPSEKLKENGNTAVIVGVVCGLVLLLVVIVILCFVWRRKKNPVGNNNAAFDMNPIESNVTDGEIYAEPEGKVSESIKSGNGYEYAEFSNRQDAPTDNLYTQVEKSGYDNTDNPQNQHAGESKTVDKFEAQNAYYADAAYKRTPHTNAQDGLGNLYAQADKGGTKPTDTAALYSVVQKSPKQNSCDDNTYDNGENVQNQRAGAPYPEEKSEVNIYYEANTDEAPIIASQLYAESKLDKQEEPEVQTEKCLYNGDSRGRMCLENNSSTEQQTVIANPIYE